MNIVHYLPTIRLAEGGVVRAVLDICTLLAHRGHRVTLACWDPADAPDAWRDATPGSPRILTLDRPGRLGLLGSASLDRLQPLIADADAVHLHTPWDTANLQIARLARHDRTPYIVSIHGMLDDWSMAQRPLKKRLYLALLARRMLNRAAAIHCTAEFERTQASRWFDGRRAVVVPLVFDLSPFRDLPGPAAARAAFPGAFSDGRPLLFLSRLHPKKGAEVFLNAGAELRRRGLSVRLLLAGTGEPDYTADLKALAARLGLEDHAHFLGLVVGQEKVSLFQACDLFILPTSQENFGFVFPEALACGTPVITTRGVDIWPELQASGGAIIAPAEPGAIADAASAILADADRRRSMGARGREWVRDSLDNDRVSARFEAMYAGAAR